MLSCGLALPLRIVSSDADLVQARVWTFRVAAFFSRGQFAFLQTEMSPALLSVGTDLFYGSFAFPVRQLCETRQNETSWIYLSLLTSSWVGGGIWKSVKKLPLALLLSLKIFIKPSTVTGMCTRARMLATDSIVITRLLSYTRPIYALSQWWLI